MASELYRVGRIAGVFGLQGELKLDPTAAGESLFVRGAKFYARPQEHEIELAGVRAHKGRLLVRFVGATTIDLAEPYIGTLLFAPRESVDALLEDDEVLDVDLVGVTLHDVHGQALGDVVDVEHYPSSSMLVIGSQRVLVPFVKAFIVSFDRKARRLVMDLPEGLFEA